MFSTATIQCLSSIDGSHAAHINPSHSDAHAAATFLCEQGAGAAVTDYIARLFPYKIHWLPSFVSEKLLHHQSGFGDCTRLFFLLSAGSAGRAAYGCLLIYIWLECSIF